MADAWKPWTRRTNSLKLSPDTALASADLIVEAITENLPLKQKLFAEWDKVGEREYEEKCHLKPRLVS